MHRYRDWLRGVAGVLIALAIIGAIREFRPHVAMAEDFSCSQTSAGSSVDISVNEGETGSTIATKLESAGVVASREAFYRLAVKDARSGSISPGIHSVETHLCALDALDQLLDNARIKNRLVIVEGAWKSEVEKSLIRLGFSRSEITQAFSEVTLPKGYSSIEGLLYPAQYTFDTSATPSEIITRVIKKGVSLRAQIGIDRSVGGFSPAQLLTIASLIQAEADVEDYAKVSQVIRNRLSKGMPLQFDSTVHYIKGTRGSVFLSTSSTLINSPYNTYKRYGLPPTPINNPGIEAMKAAIAPETGPWLYFITVAPGDTRFTKEYSQFEAWKKLYKKNLAAGKFD